MKWAPTSLLIIRRLWREQNNFYIVAVVANQRFFFLHLIHLETTDSLTITTHVSPFVIDFSQDEMGVSVIAPDSISNLVLAVTPDDGDCAIYDISRHVYYTFNADATRRRSRQWTR
jgi:hypothetical protein